MTEAKKLEADPTFRAMVSVLENEHLMYLPSALGKEHDDKTLRLGQIEGYTICLQKLRLLSVPPQKQTEQLKETYLP